MTPAAIALCEQRAEKTAKKTSKAAASKGSKPDHSPKKKSNG
jgi:hypothetical protein